MIFEKKTKVLIVDDSASMRQLIGLSLSSDPSIDIVAEAASAREARDAVNRCKPDVMTLDVEMPEMSGLEFLERLMRARPMPVVMVSSLTEKGSEAAVKALSLGAIECVAKPKGLGKQDLFQGLAAILKVAASAKVRSGRNPKSAPCSAKRDGTWNGKIVLVGASTGGVEALETLLIQYPPNCPPTLITQHMPEMFLVNFANRLNNICQPEIRLAKDGEKLREGLVLIAPGGETHLKISDTFPAETILAKGPKLTGHRPSVDALFTSAIPNARAIVAVILTGMGSDGAKGMRSLRQQGAYCIAQNRESCVVYGMPRVAHELGGVDVSLGLNQIAAEVLQGTSMVKSPLRNVGG